MGFGGSFLAEEIFLVTGSWKTWNFALEAVLVSTGFGSSKIWNLGLVFSFGVGSWKIWNPGFSELYSDTFAAFCLYNIPR